MRNIRVYVVLKERLLVLLLSLYQINFTVLLNVMQCNLALTSQKIGI